MINHLNLTTTEGTMKVAKVAKTLDSMCRLPVSSAAYKSGVSDWATTEGVL